jgi:hypothetical protein
MRPPLPRSTRTSSPVNSEIEEVEAETQMGPTSGISKKRKKAGPLTSLLVDENYKLLKVEKLQLDIEEQKLRMELIRFKIEAEKQRADFFRKAGLSFDGNHVMEIKSSDQGQFHMNM